MAPPPCHSVSSLRTAPPAATPEPARERGVAAPNEAPPPRPRPAQTPRLPGITEQPGLLRGGTAPAWAAAARPPFGGGGRGERRSSGRRVERGSRAAAAGRKRSRRPRGERRRAVAGSRAAEGREEGGRPRPAPRLSASRRARRRLCCLRPAAERGRGSVRPGRRGLRAGPVGAPGVGPRGQRGGPSGPGVASGG